MGVLDEFNQAISVQVYYCDHRRHSWTEIAVPGEHWSDLLKMCLADGGKYEGKLGYRNLFRLSNSRRTLVIRET